MESARLERTVAEIESKDGKVGLRATGQVIKFDGFLKVYEEGKDETASDEEDGALLPAMSQGDALAKADGSLKAAFTKAMKSDETDAVIEKGDSAAAAVLSKDESALALRHFTQPPPRYTEASLVKRMEELGIGRPSTYASIVTVIQDRGYVTKDKNRLIAEDKGRLVTAFLENYFKRYVEYDFTADLEEKLDTVSAGKMDWKLLLKDFWTQFSADIGETKELRVSEVLDVINEKLGDHVFKDRGDGMDPKTCPICGKEMRENGMLSIKTSSKFGAFIGCTNYPECRYTRAFGVSEEEAAAQAAAGDGKELGIDPETGKPVTLKSGRFGPYVQLGEPEGEGKNKTKPPRGSIPKGVDVDDVDFDLALKLIKLPRVIGMHPEDEEEITAAIGRYGPFVKCGKTYANLGDWTEVFEVGMNRAVELIAEKRANPRAGRGRAAAKPPLKELGDHPDEGGPMNVLEKPSNQKM